MQACSLAWVAMLCLHLNAMQAGKSRLYNWPMVVLDNQLLSYYCKPTNSWQLMVWEVSVCYKFSIFDLFFGEPTLWKISNFREMTLFMLSCSTFQHLAGLERVAYARIFNLVRSPRSVKVCVAMMCIDFRVACPLSEMVVFYWIPCVVRSACT